MKLIVLSMASSMYSLLAASVVCSLNFAGRCIHVYTSVAVCSGVLGLSITLKMC